MSQEYVERHTAGYRIPGIRVSLDSIVYAFLGGLSPESIAEDFPFLLNGLERCVQFVTIILAITFRLSLLSDVSFVSSLVLVCE